MLRLDDILLAIGLFYLFCFLLKVLGIALKRQLETTLIMALAAFLTYFTLPLLVASL